MRHLSALLIGTLLLCHGVFGALHLVCDPLEWCIGGAQHSAEHQTAPGAGDAHEHHTDHGGSTAYFAVVALGLLALILRLLPKCAAGLRIGSACVGLRSFVGCPPYCVPHQPPHYPFFRCSGSKKHFAPATRERASCTRSITHQGGCLEDTSDEGVVARAAPGSSLPASCLRGRREWPAG